MTLKKAIVLLLSLPSIAILTSIMVLALLEHGRSIEFALSWSIGCALTPMWLMANYLAASPPVAPKEKL